MSRFSVLGASAVLFAAGLAPAAAADAPMAERRVVVAEPVPTAALLVCPDTHCGHRAYPDPYIWDGWRGQRDRRPWPDVRTWHLMRGWPVIYLGETPALVTRDVRIETR